MDTKSFKSSKDKNKREVLNKKTEDGGNVNQNTGTSTSVTPSSILGFESGRSRVHVDSSLKKITKAEEALKNIREDNEERKDRRLDMTELQVMWDKHTKLVREFTEAKIVQAKWDRYMRCDGSPNPVNQREINTYISLRQEDSSRDDAVCVFEDSQMDLQLVQELEFLLVNSPVDLMSEEERRAHLQTIDQLRELIMSKLDMATLRVMCDATYLAHKETGNLEYAASIDDIQLCVWGNIMKNPRIRTFEFEEFKYSFDIPKTLALTDCAVRILTTTFDNLSPTSKIMAPRLKKIEEKYLPRLEPVTELESIAETREDEENGQDGGSKAHTDEDHEENMLAMIKLNKIAPSDSLILDDPQTNEGTPMTREEDYPDPPTPELSEYEDLDEDDDVIDMRAYSVLGRIYHFDLLQLPPQPRFAGSWTITQLVDPPHITFLEYTADTPGGAEVGKDGRRDENPLITVNVALPADVVNLEQPAVAHWDTNRKLWSTKGISDTSYTDDTRTVTFKSSNFGIFCLLQDKHINLPFSSWALRPNSVNSAVFTIVSQFTEIEIEIKNELCCLTKPNDRPELTSVRDKWVTPLELIKIMTRAGLNFFPSEDAIKFVNIARKNPLTEERMYQQMALTASAVAFSWSKWNRQGTDYNEIAFNAAEVMTDEPIAEDAWWVLMATKRRVTKYAESEDSSVGALREKSEVAYSLKEDDSGIVQISNKPSKVPHLRRLPGPKIQRRSKLKEDFKTPRDQFLETFNFQKPQFKSNIYHLVTSSGNEAILSRINNTNFLFVNCVYKLLTATRILTYS